MTKPELRAGSKRTRAEAEKAAEKKQGRETMRKQDEDVMYKAVARAPGKRAAKAARLS